MKNLIKNISTLKTFSYEKSGSILNFSLNVDNSNQLKNFRECLLQSLKDIDEILKEIK